MPNNIQIIIQMCSFHKLARKCWTLFKSGFSCTWTKNFQVYKLELEKAEKPEIKLATSFGSCKKNRNSEKRLLLLLWHPKTWTVWVTTSCGNFFKRREYQTTLPASCETRIQVKKQWLEQGIEQKTGSDWERSTSKLHTLSPEYSPERLMLKLNLQYFGHLCEELTHWKRPWCWERLKAE